MHHPSQQPHGPRTHERGIALVAAVLLLLLTSVLAGTFMASTSSERSISGNVHVARASLVAADAGVRVAQQFMANVGKTKLDSCSTAWTGVGVVVKKPDSLFKTGAYLVSSTNPRFTASGTVAFVDSALSDSSQTYDYQYTITSSGGFGAAGGRAVLSRGILRLSVNRGSFSDYLIFTNTHLTPSGSDIWFTSGTTFDGRVHTNGEFRFAYQPYFQDLVTSVNSRAWYYNTGNPKELNANYNGVKDVPEFHGGFTRGSANIPLPTNSFNQQSAALGLGGGAVAPTNNQINYAITGGASSSGSAPANGIYPVLLRQRGRQEHDRWVLHRGQPRLVHDVRHRHRPAGLSSQAGRDAQDHHGRSGGQRHLGQGRCGLAGGLRRRAARQRAVRDRQHLEPLRPESPDRQRHAAADDRGQQPAAHHRGQRHRHPARHHLSGLLQRPERAGDLFAERQRPGRLQRPERHAPRRVRDGDRRHGRLLGRQLQLGQPEGDVPPPRRHGVVVLRRVRQFNTDGTPAHGYNRDFHYDRRGFKPPFFPTTTRFDVDTPVARTLSWQEM